jgi:hypothetical protein
MTYDLQKKILYSKLVRSHQEFMHNHKTINIHCMERDEMKTCAQKVMEIQSVIAVDETVITERNGTWVLVLKYNTQTGFEQEVLDAIDCIIVRDINKNTLIPNNLDNNSIDNIYINDSTNISGVDNVKPSEKNSEENSEENSE